MIELFSMADPAGGSVFVPKGPEWKARHATRDSFRFTNPPDAPSPVRGIMLRQGQSITVLAHLAWLPLVGSQGAVGIRITTGTLRNCALFTGAAVRKDRTGVFLGRNAAASALANCSDALLTGTTTTTSTSVTTTTSLPGVCGDGVVNQASEQCDGSDLSGCFGVGSCGTPGFSNECRCCSDGGPGVQIVGCCNPSSFIIPAPDQSGTCVATRCDPPFTCGSNVCQADHTCCAPAGNMCLLTVIGPYAFPCCPGLVCQKPAVLGLDCCVPDAGPCTTNAECCSNVCNASGTCDPS